MSSPVLSYVTKFILFLFCLSLSSNSNAQGDSNPSNSWQVEVAGSRAFIKNQGQFNDRGLERTDPILYGATLGTVQILFSKKGISYCFEKKKKNKNREKGSHEGKFKFYRDVIQTEWIGANKNAKIRYISKEYVIPVRTMVYGNKVAIVDFTSPMTTIIIQKAEIAKAYMNHFNLLWKTAKP